MAELIFKEEVYKIVGAAMEVHNVLGPGFLEAVYQEALAIEFGLRNIPFTEQTQLKLQYKGYPLKRWYTPDFFCYKKIVVEIKAIKKCGENEEAQIINALQTSQKKVGALISFGEPSFYWKRYIN